MRVDLRMLDDAYAKLPLDEAHALFRAFMLAHPEAWAEWVTVPGTPPRLTRKEQ